LVRLLEESPQRPSIVEKSVPPAIEAVIEKAMARDPGERFATAVELDAALAPFDEPSRSTLAGTMSTIPAPDAKALGRKARLARPLAVALASLAALSAAIGVGVTLTLVVDGLSSTTTIGTPELVLVGIGTAVAFGLAGASAYRALGSAWRSVAMVDAVTGRFARVLLVGLATFGTLELSASAYAALHLHQPASNDPLWAAARTLIALGAGGATAVLARPRR
jgi:serine/threonine-protein kinase